MTQETNTEATPATDGGSGDLFNTAAGWVLFAGIMALGLSILSDKFFHGYDPERPEQLGYVIEGVEEDSAGPVEVSFDEALSLVSAADGERVFAKCSACHSIEEGGADGVGPNLHNIMGASVGGKSGYSYSSAMAGFGGQWGWEEMNEWLANPRGYMDGTKMGFAGLSSIEDRAAVSLYMNANGAGIAVPEFTPAVEEVAEEEGEAVADEAAEVEAEQNVVEATSEQTAAAEAS